MATIATIFVAVITAPLWMPPLFDGIDTSVKAVGLLLRWSLLATPGVIAGMATFGFLNRADLIAPDGLLWALIASASTGLIVLLAIHAARSGWFSID